MRLPGSGKKDTKKSSKGGDFQKLFANLPLLDKIRTFFKENPDVDF